MHVRRDPAGRDELIPILLAGTVSAFLLTLRGHTVLHASAVAVDGEALAFVGQSGRGKSTVAAPMCVDGAELVTDDVLVVDAGPPVTCIGGAPELRLREKAAEIAALHPDAATRETADNRLAFTPRPGPVESLPLAAIVIPAPSRTHSEVEVRRLEPSAALFSLLGFPRGTRLAAPGCARTGVHDAQPGRQHDRGVRRGDPVGTAVQSSRRACAACARRRRCRSAARRLADRAAPAPWRVRAISSVVSPRRGRRRRGAAPREPRTSRRAVGGARRGTRAFARSRTPCR